MSQSVLSGSCIAGISTSVPENCVDNLSDVKGFSRDEIRKVVLMAGVKERRVVADKFTSVDLCCAAAEELLHKLDWDKESIDGLIFVSQSPDYLLPSSSCVVHDKLDLSNSCAAFDVGLGCSGYPYGLWLASMMVSAGSHERVLLLHGETPSLFTSAEDRATVLLFGDCGSATAVEKIASGETKSESYFTLGTDGKGKEDLIIRSGGFRDRFGAEHRKHFLEMNGPNLFSFTVSVHQNHY